MPEQSTHGDIVRDWRNSQTKSLSQQALVDVYERAMDALWRRAHKSLGEITLMAITERVLHHGAEKFPYFAVLKVETSGVHFGELRQSVQTLDTTLLDESLAFLIVELLRVLGSLTGEILTPGLHAELRKVQAPPAAGKGGAA